MAQAVLQFDGAIMPTPKFHGFKIGKNKIWSRNADRNGNGDMVGTIITVKRKIEIVWPILKASQIATIDNIVSSTTPYHTITYTNERGNTSTITAYFGDALYPVLATNMYGQQYLNGVGIDAIEQ